MGLYLFALGYELGTSSLSPNAMSKPFAKESLTNLSNDNFES
jgi:hypothetical protein